MIMDTLVRPSGQVERDLKTLVGFIDLYCRGKRHCGRREVVLKGFDLSGLSRENVVLCPDCSKLFQHAVIKRTHCPHDPKPQCKDCKTQCYSKSYKAKIREVMRYSGWRMLARGRIDYLWHLIRKPRNGHVSGAGGSQVRETGGPIQQIPTLVQINYRPRDAATKDQ